MQSKAWDVLIVIGLMLIIGWAYLESTGISNPLTSIMPYLGLAFAGSGISYKVGKIMKDVNNISRNVYKLSKSFENLEKAYSIKTA